MTSSPSIPLPEGRPASGVVEVVQRFRDALRDGEEERVMAARWSHPRPPGERDMLSDLSAAEGPARAVALLSRFWRRAKTSVERVRVVSEDEAEVYERVVTPQGETLSIVTLLRRDPPGGRWLVVCTGETQDERLVMWLTTAQADIGEGQWTARFRDAHGPGAELLMDVDEGVISHPARGWLAQVRGPYVPERWPKTLPRSQARVVELTFPLSDRVEDRRGQLHWALTCADVTATLHDSESILLPAHDKLVLPQALWQAVRQELAPEQTFRLWARLDEVQGAYVTTGLRQLGLPELEAPVELIPDAVQTRRALIWLGTRLLDGEEEVAAGTELVVGDVVLRLVPGRRGPRRGRSYGRWGALALARTEEDGRRRSLRRLRLPA